MDLIDDDNDNTTGADYCQWTKHFNDDLTVKLLEHLPLSDMLGLVCVCRQFDRCLRQLWPRQYRLEAKRDGVNADRRYNMPKLVTNTRESCFRYEWDVSAERLEFVLQRFGQIRELAIASRGTAHDRQVVDTVLANCPQQSLSLLKLNGQRTSGQSLAALGQQFGRGIERLVFQCQRYQRPSMLPMIRYCPNLKRVKNIQLRDIIADDLLVDGQAPGAQLSEIKTLLIDYEDMSLVDQLGQRCPKLEYLSIDINVQLSSLALLVASIVQLPKLKLLALNYYYDIGVGADFAHHLKSIGQQCRELRDFSLTIRYEYTLNLPLLLKSLKKFSRLHRLAISMERNYRNDRLNGEHRDLQVLDYLSNTGWHLQRLTIKSVGITDESVANIGVLMPNLRQLELITNEQLTDTGMGAIGELPELRVLKVKQLKTRANFTEITDTGMMSVIIGCPKLYRLDINDLHERCLTVQSLRAMIDKCLEYPKQQFRYNMGGKWDLKPDDYFGLIYSRRQPVVNLEIVGLLSAGCEQNYLTENFRKICQQIGCVNENDINMIF